MRNLTTNDLTEHSQHGIFCTVYQSTNGLRVTNESLDSFFTGKNFLFNNKEYTVSRVGTTFGPPDMIEDALTLILSPVLNNE